MPRKDDVQDAFVAALEKDGWNITHDPLTLKLRTKNVFVDLGAEKLVEAEKTGKKLRLKSNLFQAIRFYRIFTKQSGNIKFTKSRLNDNTPNMNCFWQCRVPRMLP